MKILVVDDEQDIQPLFKQRFRKEIRPLFVMMVTANGDEENHKRALEMGADDFFTKPVDFTGLKEKIKNLL